MRGELRVGEPAGVEVSNGVGELVGVEVGVGVGTLVGVEVGGIVGVGVGTGCNGTNIIASAVSIRPLTSSSVTFVSRTDSVPFKLKEYLPR